MAKISSPHKPGDSSPRWGQTLVGQEKSFDPKQDNKWAVKRNVLFSQIDQIDQKLGQSSIYGDEGQRLPFSSIFQNFSLDTKNRIG